MKKIFTLCVVALVALSMSAKPYTNSIGIVGGSGIGVQFKTMVMDNFTIIEEFGYLGSFAAAGQINGQSFNMATLGAIDNLVLAYQAKGAEGQGIELDWFVGGQLKGGFLGGNNGLIGVGAAVGLEGIMQNAPIAFSFDFRPGYGCVLGSNGFGGVGAFHTFDWTLNLGVRYKF